jgi:glycosyltransferase involved in cell wall biosynthesis
MYLNNRIHIIHEFKDQCVDMKYDKPLVSICMPVYNGERFIRQALDSLLGQDYENFELIISDNASTDRTADICQEYLAKDKRIRYYRNKANLGSAKNFNIVFELSNGKYFMFAGDHDLWHSAFISRSISILEKEPEVVLVYSRTTFIDVASNLIEIMSDKIDTRGMTPINRYKYLIYNLTLCNMIFGVIRREAFSRISGFRNILGPDNVLLAELSLKGAYAQIDEPLYYRRKNREDTSQKMDFRDYINRIDPNNETKKYKHHLAYLYLESYIAYLNTFIFAPIRFLEKIDLLIAVSIKTLLNYIGLLNMLNIM